MSETLETKRSYTSRWKTPEGDKVFIRPRDIELFKLLLRYKYLPTKHIIALMSGEHTAWQSRLRQLRRAGYLYVEGAQQKHYKALYRDLVYSLDKKGLNELINRRIDCELPLADSGFAHQLLIDEVMTSFDLGAQDPISLELLPPTVDGIPVTITVNKSRIDTHVQADFQPFVVRRKEADRQVAFLCPGIEADIGTEPVFARDFERSSIRKKLTLYLEVIDRKLIEQHFGRKNMYVPFITGTRARMLTMKDNLLQTLKREKLPEAYARFFLFKVHPNFHSQEDQRQPSGHMIIEPWERAGLSDFSFLTS